LGTASGVRGGVTRIQERALNHLKAGTFLAKASVIVPKRLLDHRHRNADTAQLADFPAVSVFLTLRDKPEAERLVFRVGVPLSIDFPVRCQEMSGRSALCGNSRRRPVVHQ
jgi:hypothetical protein